MDRRSWILLSLALAFLGGCMPVWRQSYYRPEAPGGSVKKSQCQGSSGPEDTMEFVAQDVVIRVDAHATEKGMEVFARFEVPGGKEVRLGSSEIRVVDAASAAAFTAVLRPADTEASQQDVTAPMVGETRESKSLIPAWSTRYGAYFWLKAEVAMAKSQGIRVQLPALFINGEKVVLPEVLFHKEVSTYLSPINC